MNYKGAKPAGRDFAGADLTDADFRGAVLSRANFRGANLTGAKLRGADVTGADFTDAVLTHTDLVGVREADQAIWPVDFALAERLAPPAQTPQTENERMLAYYFDADNRLREIPVGQTRQRVVVEHIVEAFEPGVRYPEKQLNERLAQFNPDFATLRRYLSTLR